MTRPTPIISVLLPVYNADQFIAEAITSILAQTFSAFELIVINDGSTDGTLTILQHYEAMDLRIRVVSRENRGIVATLNEGIDLARGEWLARMDADDIAMPQRFERQLQWVAQSGADICGSWIRLFGSSDQRVVKYAQTDAAIKAELLFMSAFAQPVVMMRTTLIKQLRYDSSWENGEDYDLWERAVRLGCLMTNVPEVLLCYRQHTGQISSRAHTQQEEHIRAIQRRYWEYVAASIGIESEWIDEVMKIRNPFPSKPNMDTVDRVFAILLECHQGEAREVVWDHITRLYYLVAADCADVVARWQLLNRTFGTGVALGTKVKLWLLSVLRLSAKGSVFRQLKAFYFYCVTCCKKE